MKRSMSIGLGIAAVAVAAAPGMLFGLPGFSGPSSAAAQGAPPPIPMTSYGTVSGVSAGQAVVAIVTAGSSQTVCGTGIVTTDAGSTVYVVDVVADGQKPGCGAPGRTVQFYFTPPSASGSGKLATQSIAWAASFHQNNLTAGSELTTKNYAPAVARDGTY